MASSGDAAGFHVLMASSGSGYAWRTAATLKEPGFAASRWIGNVCVTGSGDYAVVVYAPRGFVNEGQLFRRGGFAAVVNLESGAVDKLAMQTTVAYYNPGCGAGDRAVLTQLGGPQRGKTRLVDVDAAAGELGDPVTVGGQVTSAVPAAGGGHVAALGRRLVRLDRGGSVETLARSSGTPFRVHPDDRGGVAFLDRTGKNARVRYARGGTVARGRLGEVQVKSGTGGRLFVTGDPSRVGALPRGMRALDVPAGARVSSRGRLAVTKAVPPTLRDRVSQPLSSAGPEGAQPVSIAAVAAETGKKVEFTVDPAARVSRHRTQGRERSPALPSGGADGGGVSTSAEGSPTDPVEDERTCAVPRNDTDTQVYQPTAEQVEWAATLAASGGLTVTRPADWKQSGLPSYSPQGMFPPVSLDGGGRRYRPRSCWGCWPRNRTCGRPRGTRCPG